MQSPQRISNLQPPGENWSRHAKRSKLRFDNSNVVPTLWHVTKTSNPREHLVVFDAKCLRKILFIHGIQRSTYTYPGQPLASPTCCWRRLIWIGHVRTVPSTRPDLKHYGGQWTPVGWSRRGRSKFGPRGHRVSAWQRRHESEPGQWQHGQCSFCLRTKRSNRLRNQYNTLQYNTKVLNHEETATLSALVKMVVQ